MKYRILNKKNNLARCKYLADKIGTIRRGYLVKYFKRHPKDLPKVLRFVSERYKSILKRDLRNNYINPAFNQKECEWVIWQLTNGYFLPYIREKNQILRIGWDLRFVPIFERNPYGEFHMDKGLIMSDGVMYESSLL